MRFSIHEKRFFFWLRIIAFIFALTLLVIVATNYDRILEKKSDELKNKTHNICVTGAGEKWCKEKQKCIKPWEEEC